jgi:hypothetical protein
MSTNVAASVDLGDNLTEVAEALATERPDLAKPKKGKAAKSDTEERVRILLEDNDQVPPGGQFLAVNGRSFLIQANREVDVPRCVCDVLDHAVMSVPVKDEFDTVIGYRDRLRFPYRIITNQRRAAE